MIPPSIAVISLKLPPLKITKNVANEAREMPIRKRKRTILPTLPSRPLPNAKIMGVKKTKTAIDGQLRM